jgi:hypothetical protein
MTERAGLGNVENRPKIVLRFTVQRLADFWGRPSEDVGMRPHPVILKGEGGMWIRGMRVRPRDVIELERKLERLEAGTARLRKLLRALYGTMGGLKHWREKWPKIRALVEAELKEDTDDPA